MEIVFCLLIGYGFGLFQTGALYGKIKGVDLRHSGSGNTGMTNVMRTSGLKAGLVTFIGDAGKALLAMLVAWLIFKDSAYNADNAVRVCTLAAALGAVCGHNFPFYMKFKGGKGIACTAGVVIGFFPPFMAISFGLFALFAFTTKYVSLGSLFLVSSFYAQLVVFGQLGVFKMQQGDLIKLYIVGAFFVVLAFVRHKDNIKRLVNGTENKFSLGKS